MKHLRRYIRQMLIEQNILAQGMCFPFAYQKAEEWFEAHFTKGAPGRRPKRHPDLNDKSKFKVVHGTVTDKWKQPVKPVVHGWVEMGDMVFDDQTKVTKPDGVNRKFYYEMFQPEVYQEFTAEEAVVNCIKYGGEGPWDDDLYAQVQDRDAWMNEATEYDDDTTSMEANLAMLVFRDEVDQALMMFEMLAPMNELDLDLLATELDNRLLPEWDKIPERPPANVPLGARSPEWVEHLEAINNWHDKLEGAIEFITGKYVNRSFRPPQNVYKLGSIKDTIAMALKQTASIWRKKA